MHSKYLLQRLGFSFQVGVSFIENSIAASIMSEGTDERLSRVEARRRRREQRRLSLDTDEESKPVNGVDESGGTERGGGRSRSSTTDSEAELTREEKRQERREKKRQREITDKPKEGAKSAAMITDFSKREIRERRPSDPEIVSGDSESVDDTDKENEERNAQKGSSPVSKKSGYGSYASALRRGSQGSEVDKRKERYAAAVEGYNINDDDDDMELDSSPRNPMDQQPDIMSTAPVGRIKQDYLSSASGAGREIRHSEEQPTPHHLAKQWPPPPSSEDDNADDDENVESRKGVVKTFEESELPEEDKGVDQGHVDSVQSLKDQWQRKEPSKQLGVNKPFVPMKNDNIWITHFRPVIDEGEVPKEPQWLKMVRARRWKSTVSARFPQDEQEKQVFEHRSTTPRKFKKPNPYSLMRSKSDLDDEFEVAMRRRRRRTDDEEDSVDASKRSWSSLTEADHESVAVLNKVPIQGPLKEYKKNLALERARTTMLKWTFSTDMVDDPLRFDLPKPIDLSTQEEYDKEQEWKYMQSRRRFTSGSEAEAEGMGTSSMRSSMSSLSDGEHPKSPVASTPAQPEQKMSDVGSDQSSPEATRTMPADSESDFMFSQGVSDIKKNLMTATEEAPLKPTIAEDNLEYVPKLADITKKLHDKEEEEMPKSTPLDEEIQMIPKMKDIKSKYLAPKKDISKQPEFEEEEKFERLDSIKNKFQSQGKEAEPKVLSRPKLKKKLSTSDDMKAVMASRRQMTDEFISESPGDTTQEIKSLASDIAKTFGSEGDDSRKEAGKRKKGKKKDKEEAKPTESETEQFGPCGKPEGCGTDDELDKRSSKELDILPMLGSELSNEPDNIDFKDKTVRRDEADHSESAPQRDSFTDEDRIDEGDSDHFIKKQESMDTVETSDKESDTETESETEVRAEKQVKDEVDDKSEDDDDDFLSSESENDKEEEDEPDEPDEPDEEEIVDKVDGNIKSRLSTDRPLSYTMEDVKKKKLIAEDERPKSFAFGDEEHAEDPCITPKYVLRIYI